MRRLRIPQWTLGPSDPQTKRVVRSKESEIMDSKDLNLDSKEQR
jgi:hypothetical protein